MIPDSGSARGKQVKGLTEAEKELLNAMIRHGSLTRACKAIGISVPLGSKRKRSVVDKYLRAREIVKDVEYYRMRLASILGI